MDGETWLQTLLILFGLVLVAFASVAETSLGSVNRARLQSLSSQGVSRARTLSTLLDEPGIYLSVVVLLRAAGTIIIATAGAFLAMGRSGQLWVVVLVLLGLYLAIVVLGQMVPRALAATRTERLSLAISKPMRLAAYLLLPLIRAFTFTASGILRLFGVRNTSAPIVTEEELLQWVSMGEEEGVIEEEEKEMIHGIFEMEETTAREVMVPRLDVFALEDTATVSEAVEATIREQYSRMPVYHGNIDHVIGVLYAKDLFKHVKDGDWARPVREIVRPAFFVPESKHVNELLHELRHRQVHIAIVVDEYGGTAGMVTIEDLLEEIVGEIRDEYDVEEAPIVKVSDEEAVFDGTVGIDDVNETLGIHLDTPVDTIGGYVFDRLGRWPAQGDAVDVDHLRLTVTATDGRRIRRVRVTVQPATSAEENHNGS